MEGIYTLVGRDIKFQSLRFVLFFNRVEGFFHQPAHIDRIGIALLDDLHTDGWNAVNMVNGCCFGCGIYDFCNITQIDNSLSGMLKYDQVPQLIQGFHIGIITDGKLLVLCFDAAGRKGQVCIIDRLCDLCDGKPERK